MLVEKDFDISDRAGRVGKAIVTTYTDNVTNTLEIRLYWAGKGTINVPSRGTYGPLISVISVDPNVMFHMRKRWATVCVSGGVVAGIVVGAVFSIVLILGILWWFGYLRRRDSSGLGIYVPGLVGLTLIHVCKFKSHK
ncbi:putative Malectin domain-containing protein [Helianthus annuus]|nr:putative Malectin domain-containing protein [Helianthus annuus]KAJ0563242.1 putative Malectin domain-containing protein [Helianthus annuus]KAJ0728597.1 putative Malectin domain-containing protein [Helianthus annuus]KAJ0731349.1 putative Malectin domain-containing protein [Helianthus annuus]KAJ0904825.1 putative Malectin domain-containing protein [Helianthus annuus]